MEVSVDLSRIIISDTADQQIIVLKEADGERSFPIVIGMTEAYAIDRRLKGIPSPRPMTHDLLANVVESLDGSLEKIVITDLREGTFFAVLYLRRNGELIEIDSRPSDAIALGVASETPIFVEDRVLDEACQ